MLKIDDVFVVPKLPDHLQSYIDKFHGLDRWLSTKPLFELNGQPLYGIFLFDENRKIGIGQV